jgi:uncharacterized protein (TIGR02996 family)
MPADEAFLDAIRANPEDDAPWLIYADWLEERGDPRAALYRHRRLTNSLGMQMVLVPRGTFWMGYRRRQWQVEIAHEFYLGTYPVTQGQWQTVMDSNPSWFSRNGGGADQVRHVSDADLKQFPAEGVSWDQGEKTFSVQEFLKRLNLREKDGGFLYRLPDEAEWEYACRGGATSQEDCAFKFYFSQPTDALSSEQANFDGRSPAGGAPKGQFLGRTTKVGSYKPNRLGLYDMHGNVWEWCADRFERRYRREWCARRFERRWRYRRVPSSSYIVYCVARGGGWCDCGARCRASQYLEYGPYEHTNSLGFRVAAVRSGEWGRQELAPA